MIDIKKVIKGLECCGQEEYDGCTKCPYNEEDPIDFTGCRDLHADAVELLKQLQQLQAKEGGKK